jgi:hypothetical protein
MPGDELRLGSQQEAARPAGKTPPTVTSTPGATRPPGLTISDLGSVGQLQERFNRDQARRGWC